MAAILYCLEIVTKKTLHMFSKVTYFSNTFGQWLIGSWIQIGRAPPREESDPVSQLSEPNAAEVFPSIDRNSVR